MKKTITIEFEYFKYLDGIKDKNTVKEFINHKKVMFLLLVMDVILFFMLLVK